MALNDERALYIRGGFGPMVFHPPLPVCTEKVEAETVFLGFVDAEQIRTEMDPLIGLDQAFENRVLHSLPVVQANLGYAAQATGPVGTARCDIIADDYHHGSPPLKRRIGVEVAAQMTGEQQGLSMKHHADREGFIEKGMLDFLLLALLVGREDFLPSGFVK